MLCLFMCLCIMCCRQQVSKVRNSLRATPGVVCALVDLRHGQSPPDTTTDNEAQRIVARVRVRSAEAASSLVGVVQALGYEALAVSLLQPSPYTPPAQVGHTRLTHHYTRAQSKVGLTYYLVLVCRRCWIERSVEWWGRGGGVGTWGMPQLSSMSR